MKKLILGVEIGGTKLQLAVANLRGEILRSHKGRVDRHAGGEEIRRWLLEHIPKFINDAEVWTGGDVEAIGCGFGGPYDSNEGRIVESIQIEGWENFPLQDWFEGQFEKPALVVNDSNAAAWGEYQKGFGRGCRHFFYTNLGSGVGGGFVFDGNLFDGQGLGAGEFGHTYVPDWTSDKAGEEIKVENLCSGWAIEARLNTPGYLPVSSRLIQMRNTIVSKLTPRHLGEAARLGDVFALQEIDRIAGSMGIGLANVLSLTSVERIAIGGGVSNLGELLIEPIRKHTQRHAFVSNQGRYAISKCELGDQVVLVGAILLARQAVIKS